MVDLLNILKTKNKLLYGAGAFVNRASALFLKTNSQKKKLLYEACALFHGASSLFPEICSSNKKRSVPPIDLFLQ